MTTEQQIAERLYIQMRRRRLTGVAAARVLGVKQSTVSKKLSGDRPLTLSELLALCAWMDVPVSEILDGLTDNPGARADNRCSLPSEIDSVSSQVTALERMSA